MLLQMQIIINTMLDHQFMIMILIYNILTNRKVCYEL